MSAEELSCKCRCSIRFNSKFLKFLVKLFQLLLQSFSLFILCRNFLFKIRSFLSHSGFNFARPLAVVESIFTSIVVKLFEHIHPVQNLILNVEVILLKSSYALAESCNLAVEQLNEPNWVMCVTSAVVYFIQHAEVASLI